VILQQEDEVTCTLPSSSEKDSQDEHLMLQSTNPISVSSSVVNSSLTNSCSDAGFSNASTDYEHYAAPNSKSSSTTQAATEERTLIQKTKGKKKPASRGKKKGKADSGNTNAKPKRPMSSYNFFFQDERARILADEALLSKGMTPSCVSCLKSSGPHHVASFEELGEQLQKGGKTLITRPWLNTALWPRKNLRDI